MPKGTQGQPLLVLNWSEMIWKLAKAEGAGYVSIDFEELSEDQAKGLLKGAMRALSIGAMEGDSACKCSPITPLKTHQNTRR